MTMDTLFLCRPCIEKMPQYQTVERVEIGSPGRAKDTCDMCCCRRYGYNCAVEFVEPTHSILDLDLSDFPHFKRLDRSSKEYRYAKRISPWRKTHRAQRGYKRP